MGVLDVDVSKKTVLRLPALYEVGRIGYDFSAMHLFLRLFAGVCSSLIMWFIMRYTFANGILHHHGMVSGHWVLGLFKYNITKKKRFEIIFNNFFL